MLLATGSAFDFIQFIQILCWIILPVFLLATLLTVFLHYRKKKLARTDAPHSDETFLHASPELLGYTKGDGEYVFFDHSSVINEYKRRLTFNHAKYTALQHDLEQLETRYAVLAQHASLIINPKNTDMENLHDNTAQSLEKEIDKKAAQYAAEKKELNNRFEYLSKSYQSLEKEHEALMEKISRDGVTDEDRLNIIDRWKEENHKLKEKVAGQAYLKTVLEEKQVQIEFLQNQLEQRIKANHQSEHERERLKTDLEESKLSNESAAQQLAALKDELAHTRKENDKLQMIVAEKEGLLHERQQLLASKLDHITWLENTLHETKEQNELLNASAADGKDVIAVLQEQLADEQNHAQALEQRLAAKKQVMQRLYKDFSAVMSDDQEASPVIDLTEYINRDNEEVVAQ